LKKDFNDFENKFFSFAWIGLFFGIVFNLAILGGVGYVVYLLLLHFGIL